MSERSKKHVILTSWASVATALLLVVLIGGAFYVADLKTRQCETCGTTYQDDNGERIHEDVNLDGDTQTELITKKSDDGNIEAIAEIDYKKKITAVYLPSLDMCILAAGVNVDWLDEWDNQTKNQTPVNYMITGNKVTDLSILPKGMIPFCEGTDTYWMQSDDVPKTEVHRTRRYLKPGETHICRRWSQTCIKPITRCLKSEYAGCAQYANTCVEWRDDDK